jgi:hypothetical protein
MRSEATVSVLWGKSRGLKLDTLKLNGILGCSPYLDQVTVMQYYAGIPLRLSVFYFRYAIMILPLSPIIWNAKGYFCHLHLSSSYLGCQWESNPLSLVNKAKSGDQCDTS